MHGVGARGPLTTIDRVWMGITESLLHSSEGFPLSVHF